MIRAGSLFDLVGFSFGSAFNYFLGTGLTNEVAYRFFVCLGCADSLDESLVDSSERPTDLPFLSLTSGEAREVSRLGG